MEENKLNEELEKAKEELNEIEKNDKHKGLIIFMIVISALILIFEEDVFVSDWVESISPYCSTIQNRFL